MANEGSGKGRPTPKRSGARRPAPPPPRSRKEAAARLKERQQREREQRAAARGRGTDGAGRSAPVRAGARRDQGPVRALVRDLVDSRRHPSVLLLPAALLTLVGRSVHSTQVQNAVGQLWLFALLLFLADMTGTAMLVGRRVRREFPQERVGGHVGYGLMRSTQFRRLRLPRPAVRIGQKV